MQNLLQNRQRLEIITQTAGGFFLIFVFVLSLPMLALLGLSECSGASASSWHSCDYQQMEAAEDLIPSVVIYIIGGILALKMQAILQFFDELIALAEPLADAEGRIHAPGHRLPIERISASVAQQVAAIDGAFADTMSYCEWMQTLTDHRALVQQKMSGQSSGNYGSLR